MVSGPAPADRRLSIAASVYLTDRHWSCGWSSSWAHENSSPGVVVNRPADDRRRHVPPTRRRNEPSSTKLTAWLRARLLTRGRGARSPGSWVEPLHDDARASSRRAVTRFTGADSAGPRRLSSTRRQLRKKPQARPSRGAVSCGGEVSGCAKIRWAAVASWLHPDRVPPRARARTCHQGATVDPEVLRLREAAWRAWFAGDEAALTRMLPPEFIGINMQAGPFSTREKTLEQARAFRAAGGRLVRLEFPETRAQRYGDVVVLYGRYVAVHGVRRERADGERPPHRGVRAAGRTVAPPGLAPGHRGRTLRGRSGEQRRLSCVSSKVQEVASTNEHCSRNCGRTNRRQPGR